VPIAVAIVETVDHESAVDAAHHDVSHRDALDHGHTTATAARLDAQAAIGAIEAAALDRDIADAAAAFAAQHDAAMTALHVAATDTDIGRRLAHLARQRDLVRLDGDAVVADREPHADDVHVLASLGVEPVSVGGIRRIGDRKIEKGE